MQELKLGKLPPKIDKRTIRLATVIRKELLPPLPDAHDIDSALGGIENNNMYANDVYGNCVIAARAHQTLRFEKFEQKLLIPITDEDVIDEYFKETGGSDSGLIMLLSLNAWRKGWEAAGRNYNIYAYGSIDPKNHDEVKHCIHLLGGVNFGMQVTESAMKQHKAGETWDIVSNPGSVLGGHGVYVMVYHNVYPGLICETWGKKQAMTWKFWDRYVDECYGIVDDRNEWLGDDSPVDVEKLDGYLSEITSSEISSDCPIAKGYVNFGNFVAKTLGRKSRIPNPVIRVKEDEMVS